MIPYTRVPERLNTNEFFIEVLFPLLFQDRTNGPDPISGIKVEISDSMITYFRKYLFMVGAYESFRMLYVIFAYLFTESDSKRK